MKQNAEHFKVNIKKKSVDLATVGPIALGSATSRPTEDLKTKFVAGGPTTNLSFELYTTSIDKIKKNSTGTNYIISLPNKTG